MREEAGSDSEQRRFTCNWKRWCLFSDRLRMSRGENQVSCVLLESASCLQGSRHYRLRAECGPPSVFVWPVN
jgi:hypothetical protein